VLCDSQAFLPSNVAGEAFEMLDVGQRGKVSQHVRFIPLPIALLVCSDLLASCCVCRKLYPRHLGSDTCRPQAYSRGS